MIYSELLSGKYIAQVIVEMKYQIVCVPDIEPEQVDHIPEIIFHVTDSAVESVAVSRFGDVPMLNLTDFDNVKFRSGVMQMHDVNADVSARQRIRQFTEVSADAKSGSAVVVVEQVEIHFFILLLHGWF